MTNSAGMTVQSRRFRCSQKTEYSPRAWVKKFSLYSLNCGLIKPDLSSYLEITDLSLNQQARKEVGGYFDENIRDCPSISDMFYTPIGTDIILTFNNANIAPYIYESNSYMVMNKKNIFERHYNFGFSWYHCKKQTSAII